MSVSIILFLLFYHWVADFVMQTHWQAINKSSNWRALLAHTGIYSLMWLMILLVIFGIGVGIKFAIITFIFHTITDFFTSRWTYKLYKEEDYHNFFVVIGFDQVLHFIQIIITFKFLTL